MLNEENNVRFHFPSSIKFYDYLVFNNFTYSHGQVINYIQVCIFNL